MNSNLEFKFSNQSSNLEKKLLSLKPYPPLSLKLKKKKLKKELPAVRCFGWLFSLMNIASSFADDNVENNDQVILPGIKTETF